MKLQFFKCEHCGNIAVKLFDEGPALFCCGEKMSELVPDSVEASHEKHIPVIDFVDGVVRVKVGEEPHPMIDTHWITMIVLETNRGFQYAKLNPARAVVVQVQECSMESRSSDRLSCFERMIRCLKNERGITYGGEFL